MKKVDLLVNVENEVLAIFSNISEGKFPYHNILHTKSVVFHCNEIAAYYVENIESWELLALIIAAWFHDTGYLNGMENGHEERGVLIMTTYLQPYELPERVINTAARCILATKYPTNPHTLPEKIICDADTYHLGTHDFLLTDKQVKHELELRLGKKIEKWNEKTLTFLQSHQFYTTYCQKRLNHGKQENINLLITNLQKSE